MLDEAAPRFLLARIKRPPGVYRNLVCVKLAESLLSDRDSLMVGQKLVHFPQLIDVHDNDWDSVDVNGYLMLHYSSFCWFTRDSRLVAIVLVIKKLLIDLLKEKRKLKERLGWAAA